METTPSSQSKKTGFNIRFDYKIVSIVLLVIVLGMLALWRPWEAKASANDRTIEVTGQSTVSATPDQFVFNPTYEFKNADRQAAINAASKKGDEIVSKLKELGVADNKIKTNTDGYDYPVFTEKTSVPTYTLRLTVTVTDKDQVQKVQDYLATTSPTGAVSPVASFSESKRNELEAQARDAATKDARTKAEQSAKNLKFKLSSVKTVSDGAGFSGGPITFPNSGVRTMQADAIGAQEAGLAVQPGENDLNYSVTVTYYIK
jgi:uncharacterized protein YggE